MITLYQCRHCNKCTTCAGRWAQERLWGWGRGTWGYARALYLAIILLSREKCSKHTFFRERDLCEPKERHKPLQIRGLHLCLEQPRGFRKVHLGHQVRGLEQRGTEPANQQDLPPATPPSILPEPPCFHCFLNWGAA